VGVHSFTLFHTPGNMKCDSKASLLGGTFASPCLYHKPKVKVATTINMALNIYVVLLLSKTSIAISLTY
jgi:hypothetical protein